MSGTEGSPNVTSGLQLSVVLMYKFQDFQASVVTNVIMETKETTPSKTAKELHLLEYSKYWCNQALKSI